VAKEQPLGLVDAIHHLGKSSSPSEGHRAPLRLAFAQTLRTVCGVVQIEGVRVTERDGRWLVDRLRAAGRADDVTAAYAIEVAIESGEESGCLTSAEKDAVIAALGQHPSTLIKLRTQLARDLRDRAD
jgi:hypothetical protein